MRRQMEARRADGKRSVEHELTHPRSWMPAVKASDLVAALTDPAEMARQDPVAPKPRLLLERLRIVGDDRLTASDGALYELLLALARQQGFETGVHSVPAEVAHAYLGTTRWTDLKRSVQRLSETRVAFAYRSPIFREAGEVAMVNIWYREGVGPHRGRNEIHWEFPSILRAVLTAARLYDFVELAAFPRFKSKYAGRLYGLAVSHRTRGGWTTTPAELAEALGWTAASFHWGSFVQRCLEPAMADIDRHVGRISVAYQEVRGSGRGKRVERIVFMVENVAAARLDEMKTPKMGQRVMRAIVGKDTLHPAQLLPSPRLIGRACRRLSPIIRHRQPTFAERKRFFWPKSVNVGWRVALDQARFGIFRGATEPESWNLRCDDLLDAIETDGLEATFLRWLDGEARTPYHMSGATPSMESRTAHLEYYERYVGFQEVARGATRAKERQAVIDSIVAPDVSDIVSVPERGVMLTSSSDNEDAADAYAWERDYLDDDREPPAFDPMTAPALEEPDDIPY